MRFILLLIFAMFLWGGGWSALKILTYSVGVEVLSLWRFIIMVLAFIPILIYIKIPLRLPKDSLRYILSSSVLNVAFMVFAYLGVKASTAGNGGVIITVLSPLFTFILSMVLFKLVHTKLQYLGLLIGLFGGFIMLDIMDMETFFQNGELYFVLAAMTWAGISVLAQQSHSYIHPIHYSFFIACFSMLILFVVTISEDISIVFDQGLKFWSALLYLGVFGQTIATTIYFLASGKIGSSVTSSFMFLVPLFALLISYLVLGEPLKMNIILGGCISLFSVYLINKK